MNATLLKIISFFTTIIMFFTTPGGHIMKPILHWFCPDYLEVNEEYECKPLEDGDAVYFKHPYLATEGQNGMHSNSYNTGSYDFDAPTGKNIEVNSKSMNVIGGFCATTMFDSKGRLMCISGNVENALNSMKGDEKVHVLNIKELTGLDNGEEIQNTLAVCKDGIYIVSDYAMYRFEIGRDGNPAYTWRTVFKVHTGNGVNWNNSYGPITIGPNGTAYVGVFNGIVSVRDGAAK